MRSQPISLTRPHPTRPFRWPHALPVHRHRFDPTRLSSSLLQYSSSLVATAPIQFISRRRRSDLVGLPSSSVLSGAPPIAATPSPRSPPPPLSLSSLHHLVRLQRWAIKDLTGVEDNMNSWAKPRNDWGRSQMIGQNDWQKKLLRKIINDRAKSQMT
jgi:hypothetical protein